jgi:hypothetical protein
MKRLVLGVFMIIVSVSLAGEAYHRYTDTEVKPIKKYSPSCGYTIIEFGVGIDCNGDTVKIIKRDGAQVLSAQQSVPS